VALAAIATDAIKVATGPRGQLLHRCEAHGCIRIFLREHARRRWCSNTCGDRVRAARHNTDGRGDATAADVAELVIVASLDRGSRSAAAYVSLGA